MVQEQLDILKENSARVLISYTNGYLDSKLRGTGEEGEIFEHCLRLHYLYGIMKEAYLNGGVTYVGNSTIDLTDVYHKIWHYSGIYEDVDLADYSDIEEDDGDGEPPLKGGDTVSEDHYRVGEVAVVAGANVVTFYKNGVASPFPNTNYQVDPWVEAYSGYMQRNLVVTKMANGFIANDILEAGVLKYQAILNS